MEDEWTPQLIALLDIPRRDLPMIWDADFMLGPRGAGFKQFLHILDIGRIGVSASSYDRRDSTLYAWAASPGSPNTRR